MPRTRPLTDEQRDAEIRKCLCTDIMDRLNEKRGRERKSNEAFAKELGIGRTTWFRWNAGELAVCEFGNLLTVLHRAGLRLSLEVRQ